MTTRSTILRVVARAAVPMTLAVSVVIFLQGHDAPGGGFIAGVMGAAAGALYLMAFGLDAARRFSWWRLSVVGLAISIATGFAPIFAGDTFMDHWIWEPHVPLLGHLHIPTATFFDVGVYCIVVGTLLTIFVELASEGR